MNGEPTPISNPLPVDMEQLIKGIYKLKFMIINADTKDELMKVYPFYNIVMVQIARIEDREISIRRYENAYDLFWQKYNKVK